MGAASAVARRTFADGRRRTASFALLFALASAAQVVGYRATYPSAADRLEFARGFGANRAVRLLYGVPHDLLTTGGYAAWRVGGILSVFAAVWGATATVRALRGEEDAGRWELVLAGPVGRGSSFGGAIAGVAAAAVVLWAGLVAGLLSGHLPVAGAAFLALAVMSVVPVFAGAGALASQLAPTRRVATELAVGAVAVAFALRVVADTSSGLGALRWATPLGWSEELRAFAGARPAVLLAPALTGALLLALALALARRRDVGVGLLAARDSAPARASLLGSPTALALRLERGTLLAWTLGAGAFAFLMGVISDSVASGVSAALQRRLEELGGGAIATPAGYLGFAFVFFVLAVSLLGCVQLAAVRDEEATERLEVLLAEPVGRRRWLAGRLALAVAMLAVVALAAGALAWAGAASQHAGVPLWRMLEAGANCLPAALLFLGAGALGFGLLPRASVGLTYGLVSVAFVWELVGAVLGAPGWVLGLSPFHHVARVPAEPFAARAAALMLALAAALAALGLRAFGRRDLTGA